MRDLLPGSNAAKGPDLKIWALRIIATLAGLAGLAGLGILAWAAVSTAFALLLLAIIAVLGIAGFQLLPLLGQRWENKLLAARKHEARLNPIEQLEGYLIQKTSQVNAFRDAMKTIGGQLRTMRDLIDERKANRPDYNPARLQSSIDQMQTFYDARMAKLASAEAALARVHELVEEKKFEWKFATVGTKAMESLNATDGKALLENMLAGEALDSVRDNFNKVFADLEIEARSLPAQLPNLDMAAHDPSPVRGEKSKRG